MRKLCVRLDWAFCPIHAFMFFQWVLWILFTDPQKSAKYRFLGKFGSHSTIHTFKNYFAIVFLAISFQFSANKRYPNTTQACVWIGHFAQSVCLQFFSRSHEYYSQTHNSQQNIDFQVNLRPIALFTPLKIILLQRFQ